MGDVISGGLFITGTDTGVGKTVFTSALLRELHSRHLKVAPYKPACSGADRRHDGTLSWGDVESLAASAGGIWPLDRVCPQSFEAPLSPPAAAILERRTVDESLLVSGFEWLRDQADVVIVEGAGGFYSPISSRWLNADLATLLKLPVVIVAPNRLGTINQTLLTIDAVRHRGLTVAGVVLNQVVRVPDGSIATNAAEIADRGGVQILAEIHFLSDAELQSWRLPETIVNVLIGLMESQMPRISPQIP